jgi:hypothetical protein
MRGSFSVNTREGMGTHVRFVSLLKDGSRLHGSPRASAELAHRVQGSGNRSWKSHRNYRKRAVEQGRRRKQESRPAVLRRTFIRRQLVHTCWARFHRPFF